MNKSIKCTQCGVLVNLEEALYEELKTDFNSNLQKEVDLKTKDLTKQLETLTELMQKYMVEAGEAKAKTTELEIKLKQSDTLAETKLQEKLNEEVTKLNTQGKEYLEKLEKDLQDKADLKIQEKVDVIDQLKNQLSIAQQKANQGSMQAQGEAQEVLIEEYLKIEFPLDTINEIKKGAMGADTLQIVNSRSSLNIGSIYYESKRTKTFNIGWIEKFKKDMREKGADIGVIISSARPSGIERATIIKGIWICTLNEFKVLSYSLRETLCRLHEAIGAQENKGDKMELLYSYLVGNEFKMQVDAIIDGFSQMQVDLNTEKRAMLMSWNKREKQINKVIESTIGMYGSIKGIGGAAIQDVPSLQLEVSNEE